MLRLPPAITRLRGIRFGLNWTGLSRVGIHWIGSAATAIVRSGELCAALLSPVGALAFALGAWCLTFDLGLTSGFPVSGGPLAHWIAWVGIGLVLELCAVQLRRLTRIGANTEPATIREIQSTALQTTVEAE